MNRLTAGGREEIHRALTDANELRMTSFWAQGCRRLLDELDAVTAERDEALKRAFDFHNVVVQSVSPGDVIAAVKRLLAPADGDKR